MPSIRQELAATHTARWYKAARTAQRGAAGDGAFVAEAKIVAFWPYRDGVIEVADAFDMAETEVAAA